MVLSKKIEINITGRNRTYYINKGYNATLNEMLLIYVKDLPPSSNVIIDVKCDVCGNEKKLIYQKYTKNIRKYNIYTCSTKCAVIKNKKTNLKTYGTEHPSQSKEIKEKTKNTIKIKYGVDNVFQNNEIKKQIKDNNLKKHGVEYYTKYTRCVMVCGCIYAVGSKWCV